MDVELMSWLIQLHQQPLSMFFFELNTVTFSYKYGWYFSLSMSSEKHTISVFSHSKFRRLSYNYRLRNPLQDQLII